jgi:homoserine acetyltransferase
MSRFLLKFQHKNAKVVQGSRLGGMVAVEILVVAKSHINDNNTSISLPARNLRKEINIKIIQRNYDGEIYKRIF